MNRLLAALIWAILILTGVDSPGQDVSRDRQWREDLDYMMQRLEITHPNLYANIPREAFLGCAEELRQRIPTSTDLEMVFGIQELLARIKNTHTLCLPVLFMDGLDDLKTQLRYYPVSFYPYDDGQYDTAAAERYEAILGKKVLKFGRMNAEETMHRLGRFVGADNEMTILANLPRFFLSDGQLLHFVGASVAPDSIALELENDDGTPFDFEIRTDPDYGTAAVRWVSMTSRSNNPPPLYRQHPDENYWFEYLPEKQAMYLQINLMNDMEAESFSDFCRRLFDTLDQRQASRLIIDVRACPGGDHIEKPLLKGILARPHLDQADRLFLIIGRTTGSASEHLTVVLDRYTNATLFGEPSGSKPNQYGAMQQFTLPHSQLEIKCALKYFQDAEPSDYSMSSVPDISVPRQSIDYWTNRDPVLERIFEYDSYKQLMPELKTLLTHAYSTGGLDAFKKSYDSVKSVYAGLGFNMEHLLYHDLDSWMANNKRSDEEYVEYLAFIHRELPNSIAVCYDLAYWENERGNKEEAKRLYRQCLSMNPEHHNAKWRLGLIEMGQAQTTGN
jgi:hypothetical protein